MNNPNTTEKNAAMKMPWIELEDLCVPKQILGHRWEIVCKLASGCFGQLYIVKDNAHNNCLRALKAEPPTKSRSHAQLAIELQVLRRFTGKTHATELISAGAHGTIKYIVMELVGSSLAYFRRRSPVDPKHFSLGTALRLSKQCLEAVRELHSVFVIHRDIKPANFAMGRRNTPNKDNVYILDFGLAKFYANANGDILPERKSAGFRGTLRYCSLAALYRRDLGRKDDLNSHFYMMTEFWKGVLPWKGATTPREVIVSKEENALTELIPEFIQMETYSEHLKKLQFASQPDYDLLIQLLDEIMTENEINSTDLWDWENSYKFVIEEDQSSISSNENEKENNSHI